MQKRKKVRGLEGRLRSQRKGERTEEPVHFAIKKSPEGLRGLVGDIGGKVDKYVLDGDGENKTD